MSLPTPRPEPASPPAARTLPSSPQAGAARSVVRPTQPRVLQSSRAPGQMSFVFQR